METDEYGYPTQKPKEKNKDKWLWLDSLVMVLAVG